MLGMLADSLHPFPCLSATDAFRYPLRKSLLLGVQVAHSALVSLSTSNSSLLSQSLHGNLVAVGEFKFKFKFDFDVHRGALCEVLSVPLGARTGSRFTCDAKPSASEYNP